MDELIPFILFDPAVDDALALVDAIVQTDAIAIDTDSIQFEGSAGQSSFYDGSLTELGIGAGILLTSGSGSPPLENTQGGFTQAQLGNTNADLQEVANAAFAGAGTVQDANTLEFSFEISDPSVNSITFSLVFGSDEFPEFSDSSFVDIAAVFINGTNVALFNGEIDQPLSVISENLELGNFIDNETFSTPEVTDAPLPIEYDGVSSVLTIFAPVEQGENTIEFGIADTGDQSLDSGLFISGFTTSAVEVDGILVNVVGSAGGDILSSSNLSANQSEFFDGGPGNDTIAAGAGDDVINPGSGDDDVDAGPGDDTVTADGAAGGLGNDTIAGGTGDDVIDAGPGSDDIIAGPGDDAITPGAGNDIVDAGPGDDTIFAEPGPSFDLDQIDGGEGTDTFVINGNSDDFEIDAFTPDDDPDAVMVEVGTPGEVVPPLDELGQVLYSGNFPGFAAFAAGGGSSPIGVETFAVEFVNSTLANVEFLQFDDVTLAVSDLLDDDTLDDDSSDDDDSDDAGDDLPEDDGSDSDSSTAIAAIAPLNSIPTADGSHDDLLSGSSEGDARIYGGGGNDTFYASSGDRLLGGAGSDTFYADSGTGNIISGGADADTFVLAAAGEPTEFNTITDYESGSDILAIGLGASGDVIAFGDDITVAAEDNGALVSFQGSPIVLLLGVSAASLSAADFAFIA